MVKCVLEDAATKWRDEMTNLTWLAQAPYINCTLPHKKRPPYPLSWEEQRLMFDELQPHSQRMSEFCTNTGARDEEVCALEWAWEIRLPELDEPDKPGKPGIRRSAFIIPAEVAKNRTKDPRPRLLVLNDAAQLIVDSARGEHPRYVFTYEDHEGNRDRMYTLRSSGWVRARRRASKRYKDTKRVEAPAGFKCLRVHDLRHTFGRRLRATNVSLEDREDLLGHKSDRVTTDYSAPEIRNLIQAANQVIKSRNSPELTVLRVIQSHVSP